MYENVWISAWILYINVYIQHTPVYTGYFFVFILLKYIGESSNGRTADFDSVSLGSNPSSPRLINFMAQYNERTLRDRETVSRWAHNPKTGGSTPSPATKRICKFDILVLIGSSLAGRASDSESGGPRFES